ncbi:S1/P1 nuclease [Pedobacter alpinus]|uniref:S1/P1 nuclease n=1 Tax=Pedobacter alpinus TaxID=1590643 RepID=A0ABW5TW36_9SPHI
MMIKKNIFPFALLIASMSLVSWGVVAHRSIAKIAENHLTPKTKIAVTALLGTETIPLVSTYADEVRSAKEFSYTAPWHYINLKQGLNYQEYVVALKADTGANVYNALLKMEKQLKDAKSSREEKVFALKFIIHLIGDLHQPFHVGRGEDKGGNDIKVKFRGRETNIHALWDSGLVEYNGFSFTEMATAFDNVSEEKIKQWQNDDVTVWLFESYQIATLLYAEAAENSDFDYTYYPNHSEIYKERMQKAGIRLAGYLNKIYK